MQADNRFCRNCPHHRDGHINHSNMKHFMPVRACFGQESIFEDHKYVINLCKCSGYVPKDNLEYLEWCVDKRSFYDTSKR